ncbi:MAG: TRC40/GET3/ArsA family transport-energizing ATPase, partial [Halobacteria archaeon]|nr:TRC40/GET3/ArsA family transport-energizing ATPase [Halobacteria archaeon]
MTQFILYGGKGGVGKTTCAAATALELSRQGHDTLVVSTDPAHSLSDSFDTEVSSEPEEILDNLWAVEVDREEAMADYKEKVEQIPMGDDEGEAGPLGLDLSGLGEVGEQIGEGVGGIVDDAMTAPGSDEVAAMHKFIEYMESEKWDYVVFDTAPTGHTLRLLRLPEVLDSMIGRVLKIRSQIQGVVDSFKSMIGGEGSEAPTADQLEDAKQRIKSVRSKLRDPDQTDFRVVFVPEKMAVLETQRLIEQLSRF